MAINWTQFESDMGSICDTSNSYTVSEIAQLIEDLYVSTISVGVENVALNPISNYIGGSLKTSIENALNTCLNNNGSFFNISLVDSGLISFWNTVQFQALYPAVSSGMTVVTSVVLTNSGTPIYVPPPPLSTDSTSWINMWSTYFQGHIATVGGNIIGTTATPSPITVPFVGVS